MPREYVISRPRANDDYWREIDDGSISHARTVYEDFELIDTGVMDKDGNPVMARQKMEPIGFVRFKSNA